MRLGVTGMNDILEAHGLLCEGTLPEILGDGPRMQYPTSIGVGLPLASRHY